ncbi:MULTISPECIES: hypothetical protein [Shewanella]|uniref:Uncharacterized protein n=1 Tax=Shewanella glacialipiscicola TaxID=614069 RepID=A0ABQ6J8K1_9GAMM|nr:MULTISPECIES: hypothetical protein [Shewanella]MCL1087094.1 hypothetical protein [Shewanella glacialipiscicola]MCU8085316.1 hypothetical protein [Shewanella sp. SM23]GIU11981.1 hypothetical protein TUM4636_21520 [Shewanella glacialipiscicola]GMA84404.1 hypothetical protein GCM10025855_39370 [Shewanella glacialipiscicola]GMA84495.1 hypothetical protein GCM10025855_40280 [Shewanella glacialipiscicola]
MSDRKDYITCPNCKKVFELIEKNADGIGWEREKIICPYKCGHSYKQRTPGYFEANVLSD